MDSNRRPIRARSSRWANSITAFLIRTGISPNQISLISIAFAALGAVAIVLDQGIAGSVLCIIGIQGRLLCNLFDGMVAIDGGKQSPLGALFNEFPDRVADSLLLIALGYACAWPALGWFAALAAALTAYIRVFGGSLGLAQRFLGPFAKQQRMAVMTGAMVLNAFETPLWGSHYALLAALWLIALGSALTCVTRTRALCRDLEAKHVAQ